MWGFSLTKKAIFFRQLSTLINAAVALDRAVTTAGTGTLPQAGDIARVIVSGQSLSQAMGRYPQLFSDYELHLIQAGETSGTLDTQLEHLARETEENHQLYKSLQSKLVYPIFVAHFAVFVPPLVVLIQKGAEAYFKLTLSTLLPVYLLLGICFLLYRLGSVGPFRLLMDTVLAWVPVLGGTLKALALTRFVRSLGHLLEAGTLPYHAYQMAAGTCGNSHVASHLLTAYRKLGQQARLSQWMTQSGLFSPTILGLIGSGEETGQLGAMFSKAAQFLEMEFRTKVNLLVTVFPVLMLLAVGVLVGFRVYQIMSSYAGEVLKLI